MTLSQKQKMMGKDITHSEAKSQKLSALVLDYSVPIAIRIKHEKDGFHLFWSAGRKKDIYVQLLNKNSKSWLIVENEPVLFDTPEEPPSASKYLNILDIDRDYKNAETTFNCKGKSSCYNTQKKKKKKKKKLLR